MPALSERVDWVIRRSVQAEPNQRYGSCPEFIQALTGASAGDEVDLPPERVARSTRRAKAARPENQERRASVRYAVSQEISCTVPTSVHPSETNVQDLWQGTVRDLSVKGAGLVLPRRFERETVLVVELQSRDGKARCYREALVVNQGRAGQGQWFVGCRFTEPLGKEELRKLL
jgi:hypothetical protein